MSNSNLNAFMCPNAVKVENIKYVASDRFLDSKGKPMEWEIKAITSTEYEKLQKDSRRRVQSPGGKRRDYTIETDYSVLLGKLAVACVMFPDLNNVELQNSYGVMGAEELVKTMLTPGEYDNLLATIQEHNDFNKDVEELVDEAKNS